jgi:hypothetical protein
MSAAPSFMGGGRPGFELKKEGSNHKNASGFECLLFGFVGILGGAF